MPGDFKGQLVRKKIKNDGDITAYDNKKETHTEESTCQSSPKILPTHIQFFWEVFDALENQKQTEPDGTVSESGLKRALLGKFTIGEAAHWLKT